MKKAVITTGAKQYIVSEGDELSVELLNTDNKKLSFEPLIVFDDKEIKVGSPKLSNLKVTADVIEESVAQDKVMSIRYKAKKRVHTLRGHRQKLARIKINKIS